MVSGKTRSLVGKGSSFAAVIAGAPSASLAESGSSALPGLGALLGTLPVVGLGDGAVLIVGVSRLVGGPVALPEGSGVVVVLSVGGDDSVAETNSGGNSRDINVLGVVVVVVSCLSDSEEGGDSKEFHYYY